MLILRLSAPHARHNHRGHLVDALSWHLLDVEAQADMVSYNVVSLRGAPSRQAHLGLAQKEGGSTLDSGLFDTYKYLFNY